MINDIHSPEGEWETYIFIISLAGAAMDRRVIISFAWVSIEVALVIFVTVLALDRPVVISCLARCVLLLQL